MLSLLVSCTVEKRHYRSGWFIERIDRAEHFLEQQCPVSYPKPDSAISSEEKKQDSSQTFPAADSRSEFVFPNEKSNPSDTNGNAEKSAQQITRDPLPKMSYKEATTRMREKGCMPNQYANTVYWMALLSIPLMIFTGIGFLLVILSLILSFPAEKKVLESGECVEENLALIRTARRLSAGILIFFALLVMFVVAVLLNFGL